MNKELHDVMHSTQDATPHSFFWVHSLPSCFRFLEVEMTPTLFKHDFASATEQLSAPVIRPACSCTTMHLLVLIHHQIGSLASLSHSSTAHNSIVCQPFFKPVWSAPPLIQLIRHPSLLPYRNAAAEEPSGRAEGGSATDVREKRLPVHPVIASS